uniref:Nucleolin isoform X3 n=1 Tax=Rhizophora mucronata TaxID=61149 RepID=A0A2P2KFT7_RHIMU
MVGVMSCLLLGADLLLIIVLGLFQKDDHPIEMNFLLMVLVMLIILEVHHAHQQGEPMSMIAIHKGLRGILLVIVKDILVIMIPCLGQNVHIL